MFHAWLLSTESICEKQNLKNLKSDMYAVDSAHTTPTERLYVGKTVNYLNYKTLFHNKTCVVYMHISCDIMNV
jgi:hypothetical protein